MTLVATRHLQTRIIRNMMLSMARRNALTGDTRAMV